MGQALNTVALNQVPTHSPGGFLLPDTSRQDMARQALINIGAQLLQPNYQTLPNGNVINDFGGALGRAFAAGQSGIQSAVDTAHTQGMTLEESRRRREADAAEERQRLIRNDLSRQELQVGRDRVAEYEKRRLFDERQVLDKQRKHAAAAEAASPWVPKDVAMAMTSEQLGRIVSTETERERGRERLRAQSSEISELYNSFGIPVTPDQSFAMLSLGLDPASPYRATDRGRDKVIDIPGVGEVDRRMYERWEDDQLKLGSRSRGVTREVVNQDGTVSQVSEREDGYYNLYPVKNPDGSYVLDENGKPRLTVQRIPDAEVKPYLQRMFAQQFNQASAAVSAKIEADAPDVVEEPKPEPVAVDPFRPPPKEKPPMIKGVPDRYSERLKRIGIGGGELGRLHQAISKVDPDYTIERTAERLVSTLGERGLEGVKWLYDYYGLDSSGFYHEYAPPRLRP